MQLYPQEEFAIVRGLEDHTDNSTHYVQAVIRNAKTDALIDTVNLTDQGNRRFSKRWQVPADPTGLGFWIIVTTSVYTDSNYTTLDPNYGQKFEEHFIEARLVNHGPGGTDVSYNKIRDIIAAELDKRKTDPFDPNSLPKVDLAPVLSAISALHSDVSAIPTETPEAVELAPVIAKIEAVHKDMKAIEIPEPDFSPLEYRLDKIDERIDAAEFNKLRDEMQAMFERMKEFYGHDVDSFNEKADALMKRFDRIAYITLNTKPQNDEE